MSTEASVCASISAQMKCICFSSLYS